MTSREAEEASRKGHIAPITTKEIETLFYIIESSNAFCRGLPRQKRDEVGGGSSSGPVSPLPSPAGSFKSLDGIAANPPPNLSSSASSLPQFTWSLAGALAFRGAELVSRLKETHRRAKPSECLLIAQHMLDTGTIEDVTRPGLPCIVFSEDRTYSSVLFRELTDRQARGLVSTLREALGKERKVPAGKVTAFSGSAAIDCWVRAVAREGTSSLSRQDAALVGQELMNKGYISQVPNGRPDFHDGRELYTFGEASGHWGFLLKKKKRATSEWKIRWVRCGGGMGGGEGDKRAYAFLSPRHSKPRSFIRLDDCAVRVTQDAPHGFEVVTKSKVYTFRAITDAAMSAWVAAIQSLSTQVVEENAAVVHAERMIEAAEEMRRKVIWKNLAAAHGAFGIFSRPVTCATAEPTPAFESFVKANSAAKPPVSPLLMDDAQDAPQPPETSVVAYAYDFTNEAMPPVDAAAEKIEAAEVLDRQIVWAQLPHGERATVLLVAAGYLWVGARSGAVVRLSLDGKTAEQCQVAQDGPAHHGAVVSLIKVDGAEVDVWSGDERGGVAVWNASAGMARRSFTARPGAPAVLAAGQSGVVFCAGSGPGTIDVWSAGEAMIVATAVLPGCEASVTLMAHAADDVVWAAAGCGLFTYNHSTQTARRLSLEESCPGLSPITALACSGPRRVWTGHAGGEICAWELDKDGSDAQAFFHRKAHSGPVRSLAISPPSTIWSSCAAAAQGSATSSVPFVEWRGLLVPRHSVALPGPATAEVVWASGDDKTGCLALGGSDGSVCAFQLLVDPARSDPPPAVAAIPMTVPRTPMMASSFGPFSATSSAVTVGSPSRAPQPRAAEESTATTSQQPSPTPQKAPSSSLSLDSRLQPRP